MKNLILSILFLSLLSSCVEIKFEEPQPHGVKQLDVIPESIQGNYLIGDGDTLKVYADGFTILKDSTKNNEDHKLSEFFILKKWKGSYFINVKDNDEDYWSVIFITKNKEKKMAIGMLSFSDNNLDKIEELGEITKIKTIKSEDGSVKDYIIKPSKRQLKKIIKSSSFLELGLLKKLE